MALLVTVENFIRAESDQMFVSLQAEAGGCESSQAQPGSDSDRSSAGDPDEPRHAVQLRDR